MTEPLDLVAYAAAVLNVDAGLLTVREVFEGGKQKLRVTHRGIGTTWFIDPPAEHEIVAEVAAYADSSVADLKAEAKARGLTGYSKLSHADLVTLLTAPVDESPPGDAVNDESEGGNGNE